MTRLFTWLRSGRRKAVTPVTKDLAAAFSILSGIATAFTLTGTTAGTTGQPSTFRVTPNGVLSSQVVVTLSAPGATLSVPTLTFNAGSNAYQEFTVTRPTDGTTSVSIGSSLSSIGSPINYSTSATTDATWASTPPTIAFTQGVASTHNLAQYTANFNTTLHEMQMAETSPNPLPTGVTLDPTGSLVYNGTAPVTPVVNVQIDIEDKVPPVYAQLTETDSTSWLNASGGLYMPWLNAGGDWRDSANVQQGTTHYATANVFASNGNTQTVAISVTALVSTLLSGANTGIHLRCQQGQSVYVSTTRGANPPTLQVVTSSGTFNCPCTASFYIDASSGGSVLETNMTGTMLLRFDLSGVVGTVTSATMTLRTTFVGANSTLVANKLDMPRLYYAPAIEVGGAVQGIANSVTQDTELAAHPSVLLYDDLTSDAKFYGASRRFVTINLGPGGHSYEPLPQYGLTALVLTSATSTPHIMDVHRWSQPMSADPEPNSSWHRPYAENQELGHTHLFFRYLMWIGEDLYAGFNELGMKLSGLYGSYEWSSSGAPTLPVPDANYRCIYRGWHSPKSPSAPHFYRFGTYEYDVDRPLGVYSGVGRIGATNLVRGVSLRAGRWYCLEQELQLNTLTGLGATDPNGLGLANVNADGIERWWIDGVKVYEYTNMRNRGVKHANIQTLPYLTIYHGGNTPPLSPFTYKIAGVCVSTQYIGPPKVIA